jgi:transposase
MRVVFGRSNFMAKELVPDELWNIIEPILPPPKARRYRYPGRRPMDRRKALTGIIFVLKTGIPWEDLPQEMGCGAGMSCWRYLRDWQSAGVWEKIREVMLAKLNEADRIEWNRAVADSSSIKAVMGGRKSARIPRTKGRREASII